MTKTSVCHIPIELSSDYGLELEAEIIARYTYYPYSPGERDIGNGPLISPDKPAYVDVESAILKINDKVVSGVGLDELDEDSIYEACMEHATSH